jgi:serine/threonine-protein kinase
MAPEQLFGEPVDGRTDLYATGAVLFECVTGRRVYESSSTMVLAAHHLQEGETPTDPASINPEVPSAFSRVILRSLARKPADRWQTASELLHALEEVS